MYGDGENRRIPRFNRSSPRPCSSPRGLAAVVIHLPKLFFESRKDAAAVFNALVRHLLEPDERLLFVAYLEAQPMSWSDALHGSELSGIRPWGTTTPR